MASLSSLLTAYLLGGVTFLPLLITSVLVYSYYTLPQSSLSPDLTLSKDVFGKADEDLGLKEKLEKRSNEHDVAAGYFAVCRDYVPGGVNGKPPERTTPAGETIAAESPSVYQSMYRSIFERKTPSPSIEAGKPVKKARNVFYVVLRHGHLLLFDNSEQVEVRHVIALSLYEVDLYAGGDEIPEGELFIKRNCIRMKHKRNSSTPTSSSMPFYFFSENCSDKEDFYHAILHSQAELANKPQDYPTSRKFDTEDMIKLIRTLHLSEENLQTRWLNALIGRVFLALYKTPETERIIRAKITKKIDRAPKPNFITSLRLEDIDMGHSAPNIVNPRLKEMGVDGTLILEADIKYSGHFRVVVAAVARLELGTHFKPRSVNLVLAGVLKKMEGHLLIKVKPPPSNRLWISFEVMPKLDLSIEPIVSSKQITYGIVLRAIESRIREVMSETIVSPNWDDIPFTDTTHQQFRGGIWHKDEDSADTLSSLASALAQTTGIDGSEEPHEITHTGSDPISISNSISTLTNIKGTSETDLIPQNTMIPLSDTPPRIAPASPPKYMRSPSFTASAAKPVITLESPSGEDKVKETTISAASSMRGISIRSEESSPTISPNPLPPSSPSPLNRTLSASSIPSIELDAKSSTTEHSKTARTSIEQAMQGQDADARSITTSTDSIGSSDNPNPTRLRNLRSSTERRAQINQQLESATAAAKKWGLNVLNRQSESWKNRSSAAVASATTGQPYGRGQPLPQMGQPPLQSSEPKAASTTSLANSKKWSAPAPPLPPRTNDVAESDTAAPPLPPRTRGEASASEASTQEGTELSTTINPTASEQITNMNEDGVGLPAYSA